MPKMKTHRGVARRVKKTASDQLKRSRVFISYLSANKSTKQEHQLRKVRLMSESDMKRAKQLLAYKK